MMAHILSYYYWIIFGAGKEIRTLIAFLPLPPQSSASTISATPAMKHIYYYNYFFFKYQLYSDSIAIKHFSNPLYGLKKVGFKSPIILESINSALLL